MAEAISSHLAGPPAKTSRRAFATRSPCSRLLRGNCSAEITTRLAFGALALLRSVFLGLRRLAAVGLGSLDAVSTFSSSSWRIHCDDITQTKTAQPAVSFQTRLSIESPSGGYNNASGSMHLHSWLALSRHPSDNSPHLYFGNNILDSGHVLGYY
jgi:hypothetical protein